MSDRTIRRGQTLSPFGVGAIFDVVGESLVAEDITRWYGPPHQIVAPRIARGFGVTELRTAPPGPESGGYHGGPGVPYIRFPQWMFCPTCRRMVRWSYTKEEPGKPPRCARCARRSQLVPMRFVMICGNGHLEDVNWHRWAHSGGESREQRQCERSDLRFRVLKGVGGGLQSLIVECSTCSAGRTLKGIASPDTPKQLGMSCAGRQPWLKAGQGEKCDAEPVIVQRGASNVHFPFIRSAIDIPPHSDFDHYGTKSAAIKNNVDFKALEANPQHPLLEAMIRLVAQKEGVDEAEVVAALKDQAATNTGSDQGVEDSDEQLRRDEWVAFRTRRKRVPHPDDRFVVEHRDIGDRHRPGARGVAADALASALGDVVLATRLREVRALVGFHRYDMRRLVPADLTKSLDWLPAIEVYGEGIFISLSEKHVQHWEQRPEVVARVAPLVTRLGDSLWSRFLPAPTPRLLLVHTLSHLLIRQLVFETGYSSASLRERLYVSPSGVVDPMAGVLIYTGEGDSEGTLGGLVRAGEPDWLIPTLLGALRLAGWCSLDPVCRESLGQGPDSLSLAACHACSLVAETSCECSNALLDRKLLVDPKLGFFAEPLEATMDEAAARAV